MSNGPPRPPRRPRIVEPFPPASDVTELGSTEYEPSNRDLSVQIGALSSHLTAVHQETALIRHDLSTLSSFVMRDLGPRTTAVEKKTAAQKAGTAAACGVKWLTIAGGAVALATQIAAAFRPDLVGPLQTLGQMLGVSQ